MSLILVLFLDRVRGHFHYLHVTFLHCVFLRSLASVSSLDDVDAGLGRINRGASIDDVSEKSSSNKSPFGSSRSIRSRIGSANSVKEAAAGSSADKDNLEARIHRKQTRYWEIAFEVVNAFLLCGLLKVLLLGTSL